MDYDILFCIVALTFMLGLATLTVCSAYPNQTEVCDYYNITEPDCSEWWWNLTTVYYNITNVTNYDYSNHTHIQEHNHYNNTYYNYKNQTYYVNQTYNITEIDKKFSQTANSISDLQDDFSDNKESISSLTDKVDGLEAPKEMPWKIIIVISFVLGIIAMFKIIWDVSVG